MTSNSNLEHGLTHFSKALAHLEAFMEQEDNATAEEIQKWLPVLGTAFELISSGAPNTLKVRKALKLYQQGPLAVS